MMREMEGADAGDGQQGVALADHPDAWYAAAMLREVRDSCIAVSRALGQIMCLPPSLCEDDLMAVAELRADVEQAAEKADRMAKRCWPAAASELTGRMIDGRDGDGVVAHRPYLAAEQSLAEFDAAAVITLDAIDQARRAANLLRRTYAPQGEMSALMPLADRSVGDVWDAGRADAKAGMEKRDAGGKQLAYNRGYESGLRSVVDDGRMAAMRLAETPEWRQPECNQGCFVPGPETIAAMAAGERGEAAAFASVEELMADLDADD